jgi:hypothetical protein
MRRKRIVTIMSRNIVMESNKTIKWPFQERKIAS